MKRAVVAAAVAALVALFLGLLSTSSARAADRDCSDFSSQASAQDFFEDQGGPSSDPHRLDGDNDGIACESNPCPCRGKSGSAPSSPSTPKPRKIKRGKFAGKTAAKDPIGFRVDSDNRVYSFYFVGVTLHCSDGDSFDTPSKDDPSDPDPSQTGEKGEGETEIRTPKNVRFNIDSKNRWGLTATNKEAGNGYKVSGKFSSQDRSTGTFSIFARFTDGAEGQTDPPDPDGEIKCKSGKLAFTVKRQ